MCELLAISLEKKHQINDVLEIFYDRSEYNPHGWGLALYNDEKKVIQKEPIKAKESKFLKRQLKRDLEAQTLLGHVRFATVGLITPENCHPFVYKDKTGREWTLVHNGTLFKETHSQNYRSLQAGDTDSERILLEIIDLVNQKLEILGRDLTREERFELIEEEIASLTDGSKVNIMLYDEDILYIHTNCKNQLYYSEFLDGIIINTCQLDYRNHNNIKWHPIPLNQVLGIKDGKIIFKGEPHNFEYVEDPEVNRLLYLKYANL